MPAPEGYIDVATRIATFRERHPEGSLQSEILPSPFDGFVVVKAYAYRSPSDERPGTGLAWEPVPGPTNFTKNSELQNAETSAWGRAIVAALAADTKQGVASAEEVRSRNGEAQEADPAEHKRLLDAIEDTLTRVPDDQKPAPDTLWPYARKNIVNAQAALDKLRGVEAVPF